MITNADTIKAQASITKVVEHYGLTLKRSGVNWTACCPFHSEKTPSFVVNEGKNLATCFGGCSESWNAVDYVIRQENCSYPEALRRVAAICKITLEETDSKKTDQEIEEDRKRKELKESLFILNQAVLDFWKQQHEATGGFPLVEDDKEDKEERVNVWGRAYKKTTVERFGLTVAPDDNCIVKAFQAQGWNRENLLHLGLIAEPDNGGEYDTFRGRLIFPIFQNDYRQRPAGFAGRIHPDQAGEKRAKYRNSRENIVYQKSKILYGLPQNRTAIQQSGALGGSAYLVEGYTDLLTMFNNGIENVVASCGTALTADHCRLLARYAKEVVILRDADDAGRKAAQHDVEALTAAGLTAKVLILPSLDGKKVDPDSFLREYGQSAFLALAEHPTEGIQDGILWRVREILGERPDVNTKAFALDKVAELLVYLDSFKRSHYVQTFAKAAWFNCPKSEIEAKVGAMQVKAEKGDIRELTPEQEFQVRKYDVYVGQTSTKKQPVYLKNPEFPTPLTNFIFKPIYHIYSGSAPARKVEIVNEHGRAFIITLPTDRFTSMEKMSAEVAAYGNFIFKPECRKADFQSIMSMLYDNMETVYGISMLGWHRAGFYTWANGVTLPDGKFIPCAPDGRVNHEDNNFVVPGFDVEHAQKALADEGTTVDAHIELFSYFQGDVISVEEWIRRMMKLYGDNGRMMVAWYLSTLFHDIIFPEHHKGFPILNAFGPPYKGKSTAIYSIAAMFGKPRKPINISNVTPYGMSVRQMQSRCALVSVSEYLNSIEMFKIQVLKSQYDGVGRERGSTEKKNSSEQTPVLNAVTLDGQHLPTRDIALLTRCITLEFNHYDDSEDAKKLFEEQVALENTGKLSQITSSLMQFRDLVKDNMARKLTEVKSDLRQFVGNVKEERILINHAIPLAVVKCLETVISFPGREDAPGIPFYETLKGFTIFLIKRQISFIDAESETTDFFRRIASLATRGVIRHGVHIMVSDEKAVTLYDNEAGKDAESDRANWQTDHRVLFFNLDMVHGLYAQDFRQSKNEVCMSVTELKTYLEQSKPYLGWKKAKKFSRTGSTLKAYVFDLGEIQDDNTLKGGLADMGVSFTLSKIAISQEDNINQTPDTPTDGATPGGEDLPF